MCPYGRSLETICGVESVVTRVIYGIRAEKCVSLMAIRRLRFNSVVLCYDNLLS